MAQAESGGNTLSKQFCDLQQTRASRASTTSRSGKLSRAARTIAAAKENSVPSWPMGVVPEIGGTSSSTALDLKTFTATSGQTQTTEAMLTHLQTEVQRLTVEKESVEKNAQHQMQRVEKQRAQWLEERSVLVGSGSGSSTAAERIIQMSRRNRDLTAELAGERSKVAALTKELKDTKKAWQEHKLERNRQESTEVQESKDALIHQLQEKLSQTTSKMADYRNQSQQLKQELRFASKVIAQEVGEGVTLQSLSTSKSSSWRGRAQQISALQAKISDLRQLLAAQESNSRQRNGQPSGDGKPVSLQEVHGPGVADKRQIATLRNLEKSKRDSYKELERQHECLKVEYSELQQRSDGWKSRCRTLTSQVQALKGQVERLQGKTQRDEQLLQIMREKPTLPLPADTPLDKVYSPEQSEVHRLQGEVFRLQSLLARQKLPPHGDQGVKTRSRKPSKSAPTAALYGGLSANSFEKLEQPHGRYSNERHDSAVSLPPIANRSGMSLVSPSSSSRPSIRATERSPSASSIIETLTTERDDLRKRCAALRQELDEVKQASFAIAAETTNLTVQPESLEDAQKRLDVCLRENRRLQLQLSNLSEA